MKEKQTIFNIPNLLSALRILMIPGIVWLYCGVQAYGWTFVLLILSGLTDVADGIIARKYGLITDLGKILDPIADKLTQAATLVCLLLKFPHMWLLLSLMVVKELFIGIMGLCAVRRTGKVTGADWHGKLNTVLLYSVMGLHILWPEIPMVLSHVLMGLCMLLMCLSGLLYWYRSYKQIKGYA